MKTLKIAGAIFFLVIFAISSFGKDFSKIEADKVWQMLEQGDTENAFWFLAELYRRNGADIANEGRWKLKLEVRDYKEIINRYNNGSVKIELSRMMKPEETIDYWENWSKVLAAGNFDQKTFFKDDRERFLLANFNVLILAAHEIGHYLDYRYKMSDRDYSGGFLHDNDPLNCTENYADKFAVATVNHLAKDARFAAIRPRYLELIKEFNNKIPAENRYNFTSYDLVGEKCGTIDLMKNGVNPDNSVNENFFRQYTSAYFNRHRLMLENENYGNLSNIIKTELLDPFYKRMDYTDAKISIKTLREFDGKLGGEIFFGSDDLRENLDFEIGLESLSASGEKDAGKSNVAVNLRDTKLNDKGEIRFVELDWTAKKIIADSDKYIFKEPEFALKIKDSDEKILESFKLKVPKNLQNNFNFSSVVLPNDSEIIVIMTPFDLTKRFDHVVILHLLKNKNKWNRQFVKFTLPDLKDADEIGGNWFITAGGKLNLLRRQKVAENSDNVTLSLYEINREKFTAKLIKPAFSINMKENDDTKSMKKGLWRRYSWSKGTFGNDAGRLFIPGYERNLRSGLDGNLFEIADQAKLVLGNLDGIKDGDDPRRIQISVVHGARFIAENRIVFIDSFNQKNYVREVVFH